MEQMDQVQLVQHAVVVVGWVIFKVTWQAWGIWNISWEQ